MPPGTKRRRRAIPQPSPTGWEYRPHNLIRALKGRGIGVVPEYGQLTLAFHRLVQRIAFLGCERRQGVQVVNLSRRQIPRDVSKKDI